jgi:hypothetical protein
MQVNPSSYRDTSGFVFKENGLIQRAIYQNYLIHYNQLVQSGLFNKLVKSGLLISHEEIVDHGLAFGKVIQPTQLSYISYAYEWSFSMLKDAAICTLQNALTALEHGMILKDANTHNIQFYKGKPILIDTLSFEIYHEGESWIAYHQFCECFLAPLLLMKFSHLDMNKLLLLYPDGIPLHICKSLLPWRTQFNLNVFLHITLPVNFQKKIKAPQPSNKSYFSKQKLSNLLNGLLEFVKHLELPKQKTAWSNYYTETILDNYLKEKKEIVLAMANSIEFNTVTDLGANNGEFSLMFSNLGKQVTSIDMDMQCIDSLYRHCRMNHIQTINLAVNDLSTPSPSIGWNAEERPSILSRIHADLSLGLALIHHLAIGKNLPFENILTFIAQNSIFSIIEFVSKEDEKVKELLMTRKDIFTNYNIEEFRKVALQHFDILQEQRISNQYRWLFLLRRKK